MFDDTKTRRQFVRLAGASAGTLWLAPVAFGQQKKAAPKENKEEEISPAEDLMREHGVLRRILLIYEEINWRMTQRAPVDAHDLAAAAQIIRKFIEDYHEKLEEEFLFPRFEKAGRWADLVRVLKQQHQVGRDLTSRILELATPKDFQDENARQRVVMPTVAFIRMYRPHAAREDTVLFPAFHDRLSANEYAELGERFEKRENELFGEDGFVKVVIEVADIEKKLGIYDLAQFSEPRRPPFPVKPAGSG